jgi:tetratricopeptide (TPR) repeat protein
MSATAPSRGLRGATSGWRRCVLWAALCVATVAQAQSTPLEEARRLYRAGRYDEACPRFEAVTRARPGDGAAWADLGLCELRRGRREASLRASLRAVREGDERVRASAYHNLSLAGQRVPVPTAAGVCVDVEAPAELACSQRARVCTHEVSEDGSGGGIRYRGVWLTGADNLAAPPENEDDSRVDGVAVSLSASMWISSKRCDFAWSFRPPVLERVAARCRAASSEDADCDRRARLALSEALAPTGEGAPTFPVTDGEKEEARVASRQCLRELAEEERQGSGTYCHLVAVDPCRRRVGVACDARARWRLDWRFQQDSATPPYEKLRVEELTWPRESGSE